MYIKDSESFSPWIIILQKWSSNSIPGEFFCLGMPPRQTTTQRYPAERRSEVGKKRSRRTPRTSTSQLRELIPNPTVTPQTDRLAPAERQPQPLMRSRGSHLTMHRIIRVRLVIFCCLKRPIYGFRLPSHAMISAPMSLTNLKQKTWCLESAIILTF